jgi:hypothetical protein
MMSYNLEMPLTTRMIADRLGVTPKRVREIARELRIKPSWIGPIMSFTPMQLQKMIERNTVTGPKPKRIRRHANRTRA